MTQLEFNSFLHTEPKQKNDPHIWLHSGTAFYLSRPTQDMVHLDDIAWACSKLERWNGHLHFSWSVAEHQILVAYLLKDEPPRVQLTGLMHDAGETFYGDLSSPLKSLFPEFREWCHSIDKVIADKFGLIYPWPEAVTAADKRALMLENVALMREPFPELLPKETKTEALSFLSPFLCHSSTYSQYLLTYNSIKEKL